MPPTGTDVILGRTVSHAAWRIHATAPRGADWAKITNVLLGIIHQIRLRIPGVYL
jgi:hypothetical protein